MKGSCALHFAANTLFTMLCIAGWLHGQEHGGRHPHYKLVDLGTLGGRSAMGLPMATVGAF